MTQVLGPRDPDVLLPLLFSFSLSSNIANLLLLFCGTKVEVFLSVKIELCFWLCQVTHPALQEKAMKLCLHFCDMRMPPSLKNFQAA